MFTKTYSTYHKFFNIICKYKQYYSTMNSKGRFIVLEGLDRCGKSSMTQLLQQKLVSNQQNLKPLTIGFPNRKSTIGVMINQFLSNKLEVGHEAIHLLFSANRWEGIKQIQAILDSGRDIICDRYWYSGVAYSYAKGLDFDWCLSADKGLREPDLVILLTGDPKKLASREGYGNERFEKVQFQQKVAEGFRKLVNHLNKSYIKQVNVDDKNLDKVKEEVFNLVQNFFDIPAK